tara:strand:- start:24830 stop:25999 length:1170 start_codon:yes stop_codon:yes gene_type:complete
MLELLYLLLPLATCSGWYFGKRASMKHGPEQANGLSSDYYVGLNFLLNEQPDKAVDAFIRMLDVSPDTVETTLALGNFFRRRGEVDRAIRIHQNLIAKPNLTTKQKSHSLLELAQDYLRAGVLDRAETLLLEIVRNEDGNLDISLKHLIIIYEREKDWKKSIEFAMRLQSISAQWMGRQIAHYFCELAELSWDEGKVRLSSKYLKQALNSDGGCVRASYLQGLHEMKLSRYKQAIKAFKRVENQDADFLQEVLPPIIECYKALNQKANIAYYLDYLLHNSPSMNIVLANAEYIKENSGKEQAAKFLGQYMKKYPSIRGLKHLIEFHVSQFTGEVKSELVILQQLVEQLLERKPVYRCRQCGFSGQSLLWQCPSCKQWASVKPLHHIEGE